MIRVSIAGEERYLQDADSDWVTQQVERRRKDDLPVCITVAINTPDLAITLATPECARGGGGRAPTSREASVIELWRQMGLNSSSWAPGNLVAFLKRLRSLI